MSSSNRWLAGIGTGLALLVLLAVVAAVVAGDREAPLFPENTPEGTTQRYLNALRNDNLTVAYTYLAPQLQAQCTEADWRQQSRWSKQELEDGQILLKGVRYPTDGEAIVEVTSTRFGEPGPLPVPPRESSFDQSFYLKRQADGAWRFSEFSWPVFGCSRLGPPVPAQPAPAQPVPTSTPVPTPDATARP